MNNTNGLVDTKRSDLILLERSLSALYGCDRAELAKELMARFGSLGGMLSATVRELEAAGLTHRAASLIALASPVLQQALYRADCAIDCERGLAVVTCIEYIERSYPFKTCVYSDENGKLVHIERLLGHKNVSVAISGGARSDARHFGIVEYSPHTRDFTKAELAELETITTSLAKLDILFIDWLKFDGLDFRSLVRSANDAGGTFDISHASTFRYVCSVETTAKIFGNMYKRL